MTSALSESFASSIYFDILSNDFSSITEVTKFSKFSGDPIEIDFKSSSRYPFTLFQRDSEI